MSEEKAFLTAYRAKDYPRPSVAVDLVILTIVDAQLRVLLVKRKEHPVQGPVGVARRLRAGRRRAHRAG